MSSRSLTTTGAQHFLGPIEDPKLDTMPYHPYARYMDGPNADDHIRSFLNTWQANHSTQQLTDAEIDSSKIAEFTLSLDSPA